MKQQKELFSIAKIKLEVIIPAEKVKNLEKLEEWRNKNPEKREKAGMKALGIAEENLPESDMHFSLRNFAGRNVNGYCFPELNAYTREWGVSNEDTDIYIYVKNLDGSIGKYHAVLPAVGNLYDDQIKSLHETAVKKAIKI